MRDHAANPLAEIASAPGAARPSMSATPPPIPGSFHIVSGLISPTQPRALVGAPVVFEADAAAYVTFDWDMGDGTHLSGPRVTHAYSLAGKVAVSLTVTESVEPRNVTGSTEVISILPNFSNGDALVTFGGTLGNWGTELFLSNGSAEEVNALFTPSVQVCPGQCFPIRVPVPAYGEANFPAPAEFGADSFAVDYITSMSGTLPSMRVRAVNILSPNLTNAIPVARLSSLITLDPSVLSFPGAAGGDAGRSNLILTALFLPDLSIGPSVEGVIEVRNPSGSLLATASFSVASGDVLSIADVVRSTGVSSLVSGNVRVVKTSSDGFLWGVMATTYSDGSLAVSTGANP
ncbi:MAG: PKD domain-containing protein [Thermoanaerobaculia bacterium]